jgi:hypothetical protein
MKVLAMKFSPISCYFFTLRPKYLPYNPTEYPQPMFFFYCERTTAAATTITIETINFIAAILLCLHFNNHDVMR